MHILFRTFWLALWPTTLLIACVSACGPSATPPPRRAAASTRCPTLGLTPKLRRQKRLTRRIRKMVCKLQACYTAAQKETKDPGGTMRLSVTIDTGGRIEAIRLSAREVTHTLTKCVRSKILRWDFDIRDDPYTYGPFKIRFAP